MAAEIVVIQESNRRDPVAELCRLAAEIEDGAFGPVGCVAVVILGEEMTVHGAGVDSEPPSVGMLLLAGANKLASGLIEHGRDHP